MSCLSDIVMVNYLPLLTNTITSSAVVVVSNATVHDLKKAIERHISLKVQREGATSYLSW